MADVGDVGEALTRWTVRLAVAGYFAAAALQLTGRRATEGESDRDDRRDARLRWARGAWTIGCVALLAHVAAAMHFYHDWSHARAAADTARQTRQVLGVDFAAGVWFNYGFALLWTVDAAAWWRLGVRRYRARPRWLHAALHALFLVMILTGAVVFEAGPTRWATLAACAALAMLLVARRGRAGTLRVR